MRNKSSICVTIDPEMVKWIDKQIEEKKFANRSHGVEYALYQLKEKG